MNDFESFINKTLENSGINDHDKEELKFEFYDHLMLLKEEYIEKGYCESEAISRSISDFGMHDIAEIKDSLPSKNKYSSFSIKHKVKCLINMFFVYAIFIYLDSLLFSNTPTSMVSNGISMVFIYTLSFLVVLTSFLYINMKLNNIDTIVKNIIICNSIFFILEKILIIFFSLFVSSTMGKTFEASWLFKSSYAFNLSYLLSFIIFTIISIVVTKYTSTKIFMNKKNIYDWNLGMTILFYISIILTILYSLIPNRFYLLSKVLINIIGTDITNVSKNIFYLIINNNVFIPNIGLMLIVILAFRFIKLKRHAV